MVTLYFQARFSCGNQTILIETEAANFEAAEKNCRNALAYLLRQMEMLDRLLDWELKEVALQDFILQKSRRTSV